ncbi:hypothetical protein LVB87_01030 [Lysobacter sp. KIS68-7]|uniref:hypothetical protein n=1 Tax=Lysobacter sp. KIS68-7 TaxID=2904252 RepID=UPI001E4C581B|nr:hypothetical protein [Lysobacter sp. KIS68-7]UHQ19785.1 hypothetical protein LVB87_01030 [Lysobacter sp. KIS68-7]
MKSSLVAGFVIALCCVALPAPQRAQAAGPIRACQASDGSAVYTDKPCRAFGARTVAMRDELATRIVREQALEAEITGVAPDGYETIAPASLDEDTMSAARDAIGRRAVAGGCAHTPTQLAMDLRGSFALGDVNRIAESYHWVGMSQREATATMRRLEHLAKQPLVDASYYDASIGSGWIAMADASDSAHAPPSGGVMQLQFGSGGATTMQDFDVARYRGCYFVRF